MSKWMYINTYGGSAPEHGQNLADKLGRLDVEEFVILNYKEKTGYIEVLAKLNKSSQDNVINGGSL